MHSESCWIRNGAWVGLSFMIASMWACTGEPVSPGVLSSGQPALERGGAAAGGIGKAFICHLSGTQGKVLEVGKPAMAEHLAHGDYVSTLHVDRQSPVSDDGIHYRRIGDAIASARAGRLARGELTSAACRITVIISADTYAGSTEPTSPEEELFPLIVDVPDITLRGALVMQVDAGGRAAGADPEAGETVLSPTVPLPVVGGVSIPLIVANGHPGGSAGHGLTVEGLVFRSGQPGGGAGGQGILSLRVEGLTVRRNRFEAGFTESIDLRASSGTVLQNQLGGTAGSCDVCLAGPGRYQAIGNKLAAGGIPGITVSGMVGLPVPPGVEPLALTPTSEIRAEVRNNEVRDHLRTPVGVGLRVEAQGVMAPNVQNTVHATIRDNLLVNNRFGIIVHAGFPGPAGGTSTLTSHVDVTIAGNTIEQSCQSKLLVTFARHQRTLGLNPFPSLINSTFRVELGEGLSWSDAWFGHEAGFGNTLVVNGETIANGVQHSYSAAGCPGL